MDWNEFRALVEFIRHLERVAKEGADDIEDIELEISKAREELYHAERGLRLERLHIPVHMFDQWASEQDTEFVYIPPDWMNSMDYEVWLRP
jgi:hypothetical protein